MSSTSQINPQSLNLYAYVTNNPISYVDPSGLNLRAVQECHYEMIEFRVNGDLDSVEWQRVCTTRYEIDNGGGGGDPGGGGGGGTENTRQPTDCDNFVKFIIDLTALRVTNSSLALTLGVLGLTSRFADTPYSQDSGVSGVKDELVRERDANGNVLPNPQGGQAYSHFLFQSGLTLYTLANPNVEGVGAAFVKLVAELADINDKRKNQGQAATV
jgi:hypothetical protein